VLGRRSEVCVRTALRLVPYFVTDAERMEVVSRRFARS